MKVLLLSPHATQLEGVWTNEEIKVIADGETHEETWDWEPDWVVSFGHPRILPKRVLAKFPNHIINMHTSFLPWNRGADPNFWSWFDNTPKGVSIHLVDGGVDTGPLLAQTTIPEGQLGGTLRTTYSHLHYLAGELLRSAWPQITSGRLKGVAQPSGGSMHYRGDADRWIEKLSAGWDTPVQEVEDLGRQYRGESIEKLSAYRGESIEKIAVNRRV